MTYGGRPEAAAAVHLGVSLLLEAGGVQRISESERVGRHRDIVREVRLLREKQLPRAGPAGTTCEMLKTLGAHDT